MITFAKDKDAQLDYAFDWSKNLPDGDQIVSADVTVPDGITLVSHQVTTDGLGVVVWLSGGTVGNTYVVSCRITTSNDPPRINDAALAVLIVEKSAVP